MSSFRPVNDARRLARTAVAAGAFGLVAAAVVALAANPRLPGLFGHLVLPAPAKGGSYGDPLVIYLQVLAALLTAVAALSFARHSAKGDGRINGSMVAGLMVMAGAGAGAILVPSAFGADAHAADVVTLVGYTLVLYEGLAREQRKRVVDAVANERRRVARNLHDGLAQELAFIVTQSQRLDDSGPEAETVVHLKSAARRALQESRVAIASLNAADGTPVDVLIRRGVRSFQARSPVHVELDLASSLIVDAEKQTAVLRILNEAMSNAVRHGAASHLSVRLQQGEHGLTLAVTDDGTGFDVACYADAPTGWGLISMRERAELLGGGLRLCSGPATGTVVEVVLPNE